MLRVAAVVAVAAVAGGVAPLATVHLLLVIDGFLLCSVGVCCCGYFAIIEVKAMGSVSSNAF